MTRFPVNFNHNCMESSHIYISGIICWNDKTSKHLNLHGHSLVFPNLILLVCEVKTHENAELRKT